MKLNSLLGLKLDQGAAYSEKGVRIPVTKIKVGPCFVCAVKSINDTKHRVQLGFDSVKRSTKALQGHIKNAGLKNTPRFFREFEATEEPVEKGSEVKVADVFAEGDVVKVTGTSKGKGFAGVMKRHNFKGGPKTHGQSDRHRSPGSIGSTTTPGRVYKGKRMAGRMGGETVTVKNLLVHKIDTENNLIWIKGLVPGSVGGLVTITKE